MLRLDWLLLRYWLILGYLLLLLLLFLLLLLLLEASNSKPFYERKCIAAGSEHALYFLFLCFSSYSPITQCRKPLTIRCSDKASGVSIVQRYGTTFVFNVSSSIPRNLLSSSTTHVSKCMLCKEDIELN